MTRRLLLLLILPALLAAIAKSDEPNALVGISVASLRSEPRHGAELETQAVMGTPLLVDSIDAGGEWARATTPDGYQAWIPLSSVVIDSLKLDKWRRAPRLIYISPTEGRILASPAADAAPVSDITLGSILEGQIASPDSLWTLVSMPDSRWGFVETRHLAPLDEWLERPVDTRRMLDIARSLMGVSYLWGGRSTKFVDCSGLTQLCYADQGMLIPRNASDQARAGVEVPVDTAALRPGDLLFFQNEAGRINHVAIYEADGLYIHASGLVHRSSMLPDHPLFNGRQVVAARRLIGNVPSHRSHPRLSSDSTL